MLLKNQRGFALVSVLLILAITSILGTSVYLASSQETFAAEKDENKTQAYYFAKSGVEIAIGMIKKGYCDDLTTEKVYYGRPDGTFSETEIANYNIKFTIQLTRASNGNSEDDKFTIESTGIVRSGNGVENEEENQLGFDILRKNVHGTDDSGGSGGGTGGTGSPIALFTNEGLDMQGSSNIKGSVMTNTIQSNGVSLGHQCFITNGDLYIGPGGDPDRVVTFNNKKQSNIPDGDILNLSAQRSYPLPDFPTFPNNLSAKGSFGTNQGTLSGAVRDKNGNGIGSVKIFISPSVPGNFAKSSVTTTDNTGWKAGHGTWNAYSGDQYGTVILTPYKKGYTFEPASVKVTGPQSNINFVGAEDPSVVSPQIQTKTNQDWKWEIAEDGSYETISVNSNRDLAINLNGETRVIRAKNFNVSQGRVELVGEGKLVLYIENQFTIGGGSEINIDGDSNSLIVYYAGDSALSFGGNTDFVGHIYAEKADVSLKGSNIINGSIISGGENVTLGGNASALPMLLYAPKADLDLNGSGELTGTAVVNECSLQGNTLITASDSLETSFFDSLFPGGAPSLTTSETISVQEPDEEDGTWRTHGTWKKI